jgi:hypothetical protein
MNSALRNEWRSIAGLLKATYIGKLLMCFEGFDC